MSLQCYTSKCELKMKKVKSVQPYIYKGSINFKHKPFDAWTNLGGSIAPPHYPFRILHYIAFNCNFPRLFYLEKEARLRFVQPYSLSFDTFPDYAFYEIIPFFWDCWPGTFQKVFKWLRKYKVKTAIFTSSQFAKIVQEQFPNMNVLAVTEGIDIHTYKKGNQLIDRGIDVLEYGREINMVVQYDKQGITYVKGKENGKFKFTQEQLVDNIANSKIIAAYPKSWTNPKEAGGIETLTQRYWECMLSRCVMVGHAPNELVELLGYNPVIELDKENANEQLHNILANIQDFQNLVDKNRDAAIIYGDWRYSIQRVMDFLENNGYCIK